MRPTAAFFLYLCACLALAALLTYPVMATGWLHQPPHRVMGRLAQIFILLGLWPFLKSLGLNRWAALGYGVPRPRFLRSLWRGWLVGLAILAVLAAAELVLSIRIPASLGAGDIPRLFAKVLQALVAGLLIGLLEETFFRGALFTAIRRGGGAVSAVLWTSLLYALLHFMKPGALPDQAPFDWAAAWHMFAGVYTDAFQWKNLDSMAALFLVGVFLALVRERAGHIGWCVGLHAGWVFVIQVTRHLTDGDPASPYAFLAGSYDGMIGWLAAGWIGLLALGFPIVERVRGGSSPDRGDPGQAI
jgi:membrane protease YdiL (CAAX protease family)